MLFSSLLFLYYFLPICLAIYYLPITKGIKSKNAILVFTSLVFYAWGEPVWVILIIFSSLLDYVIGRIIEFYGDSKKSKLALVCSITINLSLLIIFKYSDFFISTINNIFRLNIPYTNIALPIGISFYTFQTLSYSVDVYRGRVSAQKSYLDFLLFVSLFPQLIAGPIVCYKDIDGQLVGREHTIEKFSAGVNRFVIGLSKKVILANKSGEIASLILDDLSVYNTGSMVWLGAFMYAMQIYFDFSGYSDMAIGLGKMFGFEYKENFNYPYISQSITEFWRRWHISLGTFFKDYVYIPLGGNRNNQYRNILIVWALTGLWHGASWNFVFWGLLYGILLIVEKKWILPIKSKIPTVISICTTFIIVVIGWVLFYYTDMKLFFQALLIMFDFSNFSTPNSNAIVMDILPFAIICLISCTPIMQFIRGIFAKSKAGIKTGLCFNIVSNTALLIVCTVLLIGSSFNPFIYFRF